VPSVYWIWMPIYEYRCQNDHRFEVLQRFSDEPLAECEVCGAPATRVLHPVAIHFKGSGFYSTDYGRRKKAASDGKVEGSGEGKPSESKSETKSSEGSSEPKKAAEA
jgi:putative FmdB family regulatory protein